MSKRMTPEQRRASKVASARKGRVTLIKQRALNPILVTGAKRQTTVTIIPAAELDSLKIDADYQRPENRDMVNQLVAVLEAGGTVPDPITVAQRPDGSRYIVDGQQRWAAHYLAQQPLAAVIFTVADKLEERRLFSVLNTYKRPMPAVRMRAWTGPSSELLTWLGSGLDSPLYEQVAYTVGGASRWSVVALVRGLGAALGIEPRGQQVEVFMAALDRAWSAAPARGLRLAKAYATLVKSIFPGGFLQNLAACGLGAAAAVRWNGTTAFPQPSKLELLRLKQVNWSLRARDLGGPMWLATIRGEILRRWKGDE